jgi:hypothetical protein
MPAQIQIHINSNLIVAQKRYQPFMVKGQRRPVSHHGMPQMASASLSSSTQAPLLPAAATMRPQLGSQPCTAVFTRLEQ